MDIFNMLPSKKQEYMNVLFRNCTEEVKYYMSIVEVDALYMRTQENMKRLVTQTAEARKYLFMDGKDRLMVHLVRKYEQRQPLPSILELKQTRTRISEEVGISMKTLNRSIKKLEDMQLIQLNKGKIVITKEQYLQMKADIEYYVNG